MTLDEAEKLARSRIESEQRDLRDITECRRMEAINTLTGAARGATEAAAELARAVLRMLPVIRTGEEWRDHGPGQSHCEEEDCPCTSAVCQLKSAIDKLRREMEE